MANLSFSTEGTAGEADGERAIRTTRMSRPNQLSWEERQTGTEHAPNPQCVATQATSQRRASQLRTRYRRTSRAEVDPTAIPAADSRMGSPSPGPAGRSASTAT